MNKCDDCNLGYVDFGNCFQCKGNTCEKKVRADEREKVLDEVDVIIDFIRNNSFDYSLEFDKFKAIGSSVIISLLEMLKEQK